MRGYVLPVLEERYGTVAAVVANSLVFALLHLANPHSLNPMVMAGLFLAGVYFSVAYVATRQLWLPICGHAMWNIMEGPVYGLPVSGLEMPATVLRVTVHGPAWGTGGSFGPEAGVPVLVTTLAWTGLVWWAARRLLPRSGE